MVANWYSNNMTRSRSFLRYITAGTLALVVLFCFQDYISHYSRDLLPSFNVSLLRKPLKVAVLETKGCHDEVTASFFSALGQMSDCRVEGYLEEQRYGIDEIYEQLPGEQRRRIKTRKQFQSSTLRYFQPDIVISVTSEFDVIDEKAKKGLGYLFNETEAVLFAVVHHPDELLKKSWRARAMKRWIDAGRLRFITLSDHVTDYLLDHVISNWTMEGVISAESTQSLFVNTYPPIFTIPSIAKAESPLSDDEERTRFAIQGDLVTVRSPNRDYYGTFKNFSRLLGEKTPAERNNMELYVLGDGEIPRIPKNVTKYVKFEVGAPYPDFYDIIHSATALLPALATDEYLYSKASSTIPASLIAGAPLIADEELLAAYTYLSEDVVYMRNPGESEIDAAARIAALPPKERAAKSRIVRRKNRKMAKDASHLLRAMIYDSLMHLK